jgi:toxin ParE1/3/4
MLRLLTGAKADARSAARWYDKASRGLGGKFFAAVASTLDSIENEPLRFPIVEKCPENREIRRCILHRFPYSIIYELRDDEIIVIAVAHAKRRPQYWILRKT